MMDKEFTQHLTDEQLSDLLAGELPDSGLRAHLDGCTACRGEVEAVRASLNEFNLATMQWAQIEAPRKVPTPSRLALRLGGRPSWGLGLAATAAAFLVAFGIGMPTGQTHPAPSAKAALSSPTNAELAQDNRLMESINQELRYDVQPAVPATELRIAATHASRHTTATVTN